MSDGAHTALVTASETHGCVLPTKTVRGSRVEARDRRGWNRVGTRSGSAPLRSRYCIGRSAMADVQPRKILIVDDDTSLLEVLQRTFQNAGIEVIAHSTFEGARRE